MNIELRSVGSCVKAPSSHIPKNVRPPCRGWFSPTGVLRDRKVDLYGVEHPRQELLFSAEVLCLFALDFNNFHTVAMLQLFKCISS